MSYIEPNLDSENLECVTMINQNWTTWRILICTMYRPPGTSDDAFYHNTYNVMSAITDRNAENSLQGDVNFGRKRMNLHSETLTNPTEDYGLT